MPAATFVVPGRIETRTGGYLYDRRMIEGLRRVGWRVDVREIDESFPFPTPAALDHASRVMAHIPDGSTVVVDSLALGGMPGIVDREAARLRLIALMHLPLAADATFDRQTALGFEAAERRALAATARVIITGEAARPMLERYALADDRVVVVEPGTDAVPLARGSQGRVVQLLCVAAVTSGKGYEELLAALARVSDRDWQLTCAGSLTRDERTVARVRAAAAQFGSRVHLAGELDGPALAAAFDRADLFVLATRQETFGMAVAEALAHGLPVVSTRTGAIPDLVGSDAGIVVPVGDRDALGDAISRVLCDDAYRACLAAGARRVRDRLPTWDDASARLAEMLSR
jgi:glycosyltransferase involved in cell wall biosynthesis